MDVGLSILQIACVPAARPRHKTKDTGRTPSLAARTMHGTVHACMQDDDD